MRVRPFSSDKGSGEGRTIPKFCLGLPGTFHRTVLLYYGFQVHKVHYVTVTYNIKESIVRAVSAEKRDYVLLVAVLDLFEGKEESGPVTVYRLLGLLPDMGETVYVRASIVG